MIKHLVASDLDHQYLSVRNCQTVPIDADLLHLVVNKPWGNEYLMYSNRRIEVWNLFIAHNQATSMHCHPQKKTALVILDGRALFSTLNEALELSQHDAVVIDSGVFHSTQALSRHGLRVLEFETPPMKHDLVRLEDKYGRADRGYESIEHMTPDLGQHIRLTSADTGTVKNCYNNQLSLHGINSDGDLQRLAQIPDCIGVFLNGIITSQNGAPLFTASDVFYPEQFNSNGRATGNLCYRDGVELLLLRR